MLRIIIKISGSFFVASMLVACMPPAKEVVAPVKTSAAAVPAEKMNYKAAIVAAREGDRDEAIELFSKATQIKPDYADAYVGLGLQYLQKKQLDKAGQAFSKAIALDSTNYVAYNHQGIIMRMRGDFTGAKAMYQAAIRYNPNYANAHHNIAILYDIYLYKYDLALYHYKKHQLLTGDSDKLVDKWIVDLERQMAAR